MLGLKPTHYGDPILRWSGPTSGSQNMQSVTELRLTTVGTYIITVDRPMTLRVEVCGNGLNGSSSGSYDTDGGNGGASGAVAYENVSFFPYVTYELLLRPGNSGSASTFTIQGGTTFVAVTTSVLNGTSVAAGAVGGAGGVFNSVSPGGNPGGQNLPGPGAGGGGGTAGSLQVGDGGDGGGNPGSAEGAYDPAGPPGVGGAGGRGIGYRQGIVGAGGGGGRSGTIGGTGGGVPGPGPDAGGGGGFFDFISL